MSRPPRARDGVLDAFERIINTEGQRAATMDAVARAADVSKGGLLYHFASKDALERGVIERMEARAAADIAPIAAAREGAIAAFMRSSMKHDSPLDNSIIAVSRLAQGGNTDAADALRRVRELWESAVRPQTRDETALRLVMLVSDGLYFNNGMTNGSVPGPELDGAGLASLIRAVESAAGPRRE